DRVGGTPCPDPAAGTRGRPGGSPCPRDGRPARPPADRDRSGAVADIRGPTGRPAAPAGAGRPPAAQAEAAAQERGAAVAAPPAGWCSRCPAHPPARTATPGVVG